MQKEINRLINEFESGRMSRRQLVAALGGMVAAFSIRRGLRDDKDEPSTFSATELNHIALRVTDVPRSRDFYMKHLGLSVRRDGGDRNCFLNCGKHFVALFRSDKAEMDHYCYSIKDFDIVEVEAKLKEHRLNPRVVRDDGRIYFKDPDVFTVQLAQMPNSISCTKY